MKAVARDILFGTTSMISIAMCIMVIVFIATLIKDQRKFDAAEIYKHWILFTGITFIVGALLFDFFGAAFLRTNGMKPMDIQLFLIYNNFIRMIGIGFVFAWALFYLVFEKLGTWIDEKLNQFSHRKQVL